MIPEFPSYQNNNWQDLVEKFFEHVDNYGFQVEIPKEQLEELLK